MTPEQEVTVLTTLARIEQTCADIKETDARHEKAINSAHRRVDGHDKSRARMRGGMTVVGALFAVVAALIASPWGNS